MPCSPSTMPHRQRTHYVRTKMTQLIKSKLSKGTWDYLASENGLVKMGLVKMEDIAKSDDNKEIREIVETQRVIDHRFVSNSDPIRYSRKK